tara:strand:+ start:264 stop:476 length:213 start_codon:yes stop_codon:yes gene_type:complete
MIRNENEKENKMSSKQNEMQLRMLNTTKKELWELWNKTNSQIGRDCILTGIVEASREIEKLEEKLEEIPV